MRWRITGTGWRTAHSIKTLARQLEQLWPARHPADGTVGDLSHQARRSDHNPNRFSVVTAIDVGIVGNQGKELVRAFVDAKDPRVKYIIHNGAIWRNYNKPGLPAWTRAVYSGSNPHRTHVHVSVSSTPSVYDDPRLWELRGLATPIPPATEEPLIAQLPTLRIRDGFSDGRPELRDDVRRLQALLAIAGAVASNTFDDQHRPDGLFGDGTDAAVRSFQSHHGLAVDGFVGENTWAKLLGL